jgi:predicted enzyme related to lactoylglutathione lyase
MSARLALVTLLVEDMAASKAFYSDQLGFEVIPDFSSPAGDFVFLHAEGAGGADLVLQDAATASYGVPLVHGGLILGLAVQDADAVYQDWKSRSVETLGEVVDMGAGRMFSARDPDGNYIQVYHLHAQVQDTQKQLGWEES